MTPTPTFAHPWMANSVARPKQQMLAAIGAASVEELFEQIPADHRLGRRCACRRRCAPRSSCGAI